MNKWEKVCDYLSEEEQKELVECYRELENAKSTKAVRIYSERIIELLTKVKNGISHKGEEAATVSL